MPIPESSFPEADFEDITEHFSVLSLVSVFYLISIINRAIQCVKVNSRLWPRNRMITNDEKTGTSHRLQN